jgi:hypothetical protein
MSTYGPEAAASRTWKLTTRFGKGRPEAGEEDWTLTRSGTFEISMMKIFSYSRSRGASSLVRLGLLGLVLASTGAAGGEIPREKWMDFFSTAWPTLVCSAEDGFFRTCFSSSAERCEKVALSSVRVCLERSKDDIPPAISSIEMSTRWGKIVGSCAGRNLAIALLPEATPTPKCKEQLDLLKQNGREDKSDSGKNAL